jgi:cellulose synthase/poly-beta-1,6-N-acetylglucosamine synthase-like glycosyltransferase
MPPGTDARVTFCIVNYRTLDLTRLCLRSIRKFTRAPYKVLVIDNHSEDESLDYLRSLSWIHLIERKPDTPDPDGSYAHGAALDLGLVHCDTDLFVSLHSDTVILQSDWLRALVAPFQDPQVACVGTGKIELKPRWQQWLQRVSDYKALQRKLFASDEEKLRFRTFNTTICSAYRTQTLCNENLSFRGCGHHRLTVGRELYFALQDRGYRTVTLTPKLVGQYIAHLAHATQALHANEFDMQGRAERKYLQRARKVLGRAQVQTILADKSLDR